MNKTPLPFSTTKQENCHCPDKTKIYHLPIGIQFMPFQFEIDGTFNTVNPLVSFFDLNDNLQTTKETGLTLSNCNGKTKLTNVNLALNASFLVDNPDYPYTYTNSVRVGTTVEVALGGSFISNAIEPIPAGDVRVKMLVEKIFAILNLQNYRIVLTNGTDTIILYEGNQDTYHDLFYSNLPSGYRLEFQTDGGANLSAMIVSGIEVFSSFFLNLPDCFEGYVTLEVDGTTYYSDTFKKYNDVSCFTRIDYTIPCDSCSDGFNGFFYLTDEQSQTGNPNYNFEPSGEDDDNGNFIVERNTLTKSITFEATRLNPNLIDMFAYLQLCKWSIDGLEVIEVESFEPTYPNKNECNSVITMSLQVGKEVTNRCC